MLHIKGRGLERPSIKLQRPFEVQGMAGKAIRKWQAAEQLKAAHGPKSQGREVQRAGFAA